MTLAERANLDAWRIAWVAALERLYKATDYAAAIAGRDGQISARGDAFQAVMDALYACDEAIEKGGA